MEGSIESRPWGYYKVLLHQPHNNLKIKKIVVYPGKKTSLQYHEKRAEQWTIINGEPIVTVNEVISTLKRGDTIKIDQKYSHRVECPLNSPPVIIIEIQLGEYLEEDDIVRIEDDFGRN